MIWRFTVLPPSMSQRGLMDGVGVGVEELTDDGVGVHVGVKLGEELSDRTVEVEMLEKTMVVLE